MHHRQTLSAWLSCLVVLAFGFCTGMQLAKIAPYVDRLGAELGLGLTFAGWLTSLLAVFVALGAIPAGSLIARIGARTGLRAGAAAMIVGAILFGLASGPAALLAARAVEAAGYVLAVVAAPAYLAMAATERLRPMFLALWGSVVPVGFALANLMAGSLPSDFALSSAFLWFGVPLAAFGVLVTMVRKGPADAAPPPAPGTAPAQADPIAWVLVLAFGLYVYLSIAFFTFLPTFAASHPGPGLSPGAVALVVPAGNLAAALVLARWRRLSVLGLTMASCLAMAVSGAWVFASGWSGAVAMPAYAFASGVCASCVFAAVPAFARSRRSATRTIGAIAQAGGMATLVSPPIAGWTIERLGWPSLAASLVVAALAICVAILVSLRHRQRAVRCA